MKAPLRLIRISLLAILFIMGWGQLAMADKKPGGEVHKAYALRMEGKVDQAKELLRQVLQKDSTNAMAWYELARLQQYTLTSGPDMNLDEITKAIDKAVALDPGNVVYAYYKAIAIFFSAYMSMETGQGDIRATIGKVNEAFERVLELKPDYHEALLYLVEINGMLPADMGGDSLKAVMYAGKLGKMDPYFGARAKAAFFPEDYDRFQYWSDLQASHKGDVRFLAEKGKACLFKKDPATAEICFNQAVKADPEQNLLILDLARYHLMQTMQNRELAATELPIAKKLIEDYLSLKPEPVVPLKAYATGLLAMMARFQGNAEEADKRMAEATALDPYFSKAFGVPALLLFDPPDKISHRYFSFFSPF